MSYLLLFILFIIICDVGEEPFLEMIGWILGTGYGIICIVAFIAVLYGIYCFFSGKK